MTQSGTQPRRTPLAERHQQLGARMVDFAGWYMPVQYTGIVDEHNAVRSAAGLFDLGHMGQVEVEGPDAETFLNYVTTNDVRVLEPGAAQYSMLLYPDGGVVDDIIVYRCPDGHDFFVVINAANVDKDVEWLHQQQQERSDLDLTIENVSDSTGMIAIQGPKSDDIMQKITAADLSKVAYFHATETEIAGVPCMIARTGYTGEDGFELYCPIEQTQTIWNAILEAGKPLGLQPIGLGARDTLRLEAKMALYGNELSQSISPLEAGLAWAVKLDKGDFIGKEALVKQKEGGVPRRLVGFKLTGRGGAPRAGYEVQVDGKRVGEVTSGSFSPTLGENIGLALVERSAAKVGQPLQIMIRNRPVEAVQVKTPFYQRAK